MPSLSTIGFKTTYQFETSPKKFKFEDTTDYAGQSVSKSDCEGVLKITDPLGSVIYDNTNYAAPDIDPNVSLENSTTILLPLLGSGEVIPGEYTIKYSVQNSSGTPATGTQIYLEKKFNLAYTSPTVSLTLTADCVQPLLTSTDGTTYTSGLTTPTITRTHTISYPASTGQATLTGTGAVLETSVMYTTKGGTVQHTSALTSVLAYAWPEVAGTGSLVVTGSDPVVVASNDFHLSDSVTGSTFNAVSCDGQLCDIYCCVKAEYDRYISYLNTNTLLADEALANWVQMVSLCGEIRIALECGKSADVSTYSARILDLGNCEAGCDCSDGTPVLVTGLGSGTGTVIVDSAGTPITVTSVTAGATTTYTVAFDAATTTKIASLYNSVVAAGTNITVTPVTVGDTTTYTVAAAAPVQPEMLAFLVDVSFTGSGASLNPVFTVTSTISRYGSSTIFTNTPTVISNFTNVTTPTFNIANIDFEVQTFMTLPVNTVLHTYKPTADILEVTDNPVGLAPKEHRLTAVFYDYEDTTLKFKIYLNGKPLTGTKLSSYASNIKLQFTLIA